MSSSVRFVARRAPSVLMLLSLIAASPGQSDIAMKSAASRQFLAAHGRRAWAGGYANGGLEIWTGALQIANDVRPEFRRAGDLSAIPGMEIVAMIKAQPSHVSRTYTGPDFSVEEEIWAPLNESAILIRYRVRSARPLQVIVRFRPSLNLMWPAAVGGQEIRWDDSQSGYVLTEPARQFAAVVLAPGATAHDEPLNSARDLPQKDELAVALDPDQPQLLFAQVKAQRDGRVNAANADSLQALLRSASWQQESARHYEDIFASDLKIETPDANLNGAVAWAEIALDQAWSCNDALGCGYVGGFGPSRRNRRPQYAWFFAGDGLIDLHGALAMGDFIHARDELRFIAKYQDQQTGMIWHELAQSAPYIDWRGKYPYMFVHADVTYPYISAVADYLRDTNNHAFLQEIWPSVQKAYGYGRSLVADDGLPRIPADKEGADEQDSLSDELGLAAAWVTAARDYAHLADRVGDAQAARDARELAKKASSSFAQRYWDAERNVPIEGHRRNGQAMQDRGLGAVSAIDQRLFNDQQTGRVLDQIASWRFQTDWGTRSIAMGEPGYDPTAYAHGSVWALGTAEVAQAYWTAHRPVTAWQIWRTLIPWSSLDSPGHMHEVLAGDIFNPQVESVPEQTWSSAAFLSSAVRGLFGIDVDAESNTLSLTPHLPSDWDHTTVSNVRVGASKLDLQFDQTVSGLTLYIKNSGPPVTLEFQPEIPLGARSVAAALNRNASPVNVTQNRQDWHAHVKVTIAQGESEIALHWRDGVQLVMPAPTPELGGPSTSAKLTSFSFENDALHIGLDVVRSTNTELEIRTQLRNPNSGSLQLTRLAPDRYEVIIPPVETSVNSTYQHEEVTIRFVKSRRSK